MLVNIGIRSVAKSNNQHLINMKAAKDFKDEKEYRGYLFAYYLGQMIGREYMRVEIAVKETEISVEKVIEYLKLTNDSKKG